MAVAQNKALHDVFLNDAAPANRIDDLIERLSALRRVSACWHGILTGEMTLNS